MHFHHDHREGKVYRSKKKCIVNEGVCVLTEYGEGNIIAFDV